MPKRDRDLRIASFCNLRPMPVSKLKGSQLLGAIYWLIPICMAFVTISVKGSSNRWANLVLGIIGTLLGIYHFFMCGVPLSFIPPGPLAEPTAHHILLLGSAVVATALITWYAWKWPKQEA